MKSSGDKTYPFLAAAERRSDYAVSDTEQVAEGTFFHLHTYLFPGMKTLNKDSTSIKIAYDVFSNRFQNNDTALTASGSKVEFPGDSVSTFLL